MTPQRRWMLPAVLLLSLGAMPQEPAMPVAHEILGSWGLPGLVVAIAILLYLAPDITARWRGKGNGHDLTAVLSKLNETLGQIQVRLAQMPTSAELNMVAEKNRHAVPGQLQPVMEAVGRVGDTVVREADSLGDLIRDRLPPPGAAPR